MSSSIVKLHLRPHTAKALVKWCADPTTGKIKVSNAKVLGSLIHSQITPVPAPVKVVYEGLPVVVEVYLADRYDSHLKIDWRVWTKHIDRPSMKRIDRYINNLLMLIIHERYRGAKAANTLNKTEIIKQVLEELQIPEDDLQFNTVYDCLRRVERTERETGRAALINSLS